MEQLNFGSKISQLRQNKNMTQEQLAVRVGVTPQALSRWERNQSLPNMTILADLCRVLEISADYLLGTENEKTGENADNRMQDEMWNRLRNCLEPLELIFGEKLVPAFMNDSFMEKIVKWRNKLASEGILMPVVRVRDELQLEPNEFMVLSYHRVLFSERLDSVDGETCEYMICRLSETVRERYADILNCDLVKGLTDNLQVKFPVLVGETVPELISYGLLTDVLKELINKGISIVYLAKVIEILARTLRRTPGASMDELVEIVEGQLEIKDDLPAILAERKKTMNFK